MRKKSIGLFMTGLLVMGMAFCTGCGNKPQTEEESISVSEENEITESSDEVTVTVSEEEIKEVSSDEQNTESKTSEKQESPSKTNVTEKTKSDTTVNDSNGQTDEVNNGEFEVKDSKETTSDEPEKPQHVHDWVAQTQTESVYVVDQKEYDEEVDQGAYIVCKVCGENFGQGDSASEIAGEHSLETGHAYQSQHIYETVHHDETGHYETKTIVTGYKCSSCGEVKE